jgi:hypothetical protein
MLAGISPLCGRFARKRGAILLVDLPMFRINRRLWLVTVATRTLLLASMGVAMQKAGSDLAAWWGGDTLPETGVVSTTHKIHDTRCRVSPL